MRRDLSIFKKSRSSWRSNLRVRQDILFDGLGEADRSKLKPKMRCTAGSAPHGRTRSTTTPSTGGRTAPASGSSTVENSANGWKQHGVALISCGCRACRVRENDSVRESGSAPVCRFGQALGLFLLLFRVGEPSGSLRRDEIMDISRS